MRGLDGARVGWAGDAGIAPEPFEEDGMFLRPVGQLPRRSRLLRGLQQRHPVAHLPRRHRPATFHRDWWTAYERVNRRFAEAVNEVGRARRHGLGP